MILFAASASLTGSLLMAAGMALAGALHCAGMCGGFAMLAGRTNGLAFPVYAAGKTVTYVLAGVVAGGLGHALVAVAAPGGRVLAVVAGLVMVGVALQLGGWVAFERLFMPEAMAGVVTRLQQLVHKRGVWAMFAMGLVNGLLPCGLLYAAVGGAAATGSWWHGGLFMTVFGLGTIPSLWMAGRLMRWLGPGRRVWAARAGAILLILFGLVTIMRGFHA